MKTTLSIYDFRQAFHDAGRGDQFSYDGLRVLFEYLEEYEDSTGEEVELDVIALCCDFDEATPEEIAENYSFLFDEDDDEEAREEALRDWLNDRTMVCGTTKDGNIIYQAF